MTAQTGTTPIAPSVTDARLCPVRSARVLRAAVGLVYVLGCPIHVFFAVARPEGYRDFAEWAPPTSELARDFWDSWFMPSARLFALGIAAFELTVGILILAGHTRTRIGLVGALGFHIALAALFGMWPYTAPMIVLIAWMLRYDYERAFPATSRRPAGTGA